MISVFASLRTIRLFPFAIQIQINRVCTQPSNSGLLITVRFGLTSYCDVDDSHKWGTNSLTLYADELSRDKQTAPSAYRQMNHLMVSRQDLTTTTRCTYLQQTGAVLYCWL